MITHISTISEFNNIFGAKTLNPLISVVDFSAIEMPSFEGHFTTSFYSVSIKSCGCGELRYGRNRYDYQEDTMLFFAPNQLIGIEEGETQSENRSVGLFFHPDLLRGTHLSSKMKDYHYFSYDVNEALHLSTDERESIRETFEKLSVELARPIDKHTKSILASALELLLNYCQRFYDRQFITREVLNQDMLTRFEAILNDYFNSGVQQSEGLPTVKYCAEKLSLSPNYMSDMIRRETGCSAQEHIQTLIIERAKMQLTTTKKSVAEIAYSLGFEYPQYFSRQFKKRTGMTPNEYRTMN
ncbi:MAG: transcriptional regulator [Epulopiscium sp. Nele67-Bin001]|nr:MAG: transcriptional regulator [Epulopiscium sp. Nele67-Bin001]